MAAFDRQNLNLLPEQRAALHLLERYGLEPPFDLEQIVSDYADVKVEAFPVRGDALLVENPKNNPRPVIILNSLRSNPGRRRFTLAHELGHLLLPWHYGNRSCSPSYMDDYLSGDYGLTEGEANRFASELLLPTPWLLKHVEHFNLIEDLVLTVMEVAEVNIDTARIKLMRVLPPGYVCITEDLAGGKPRVEMSNKTPSSLLYSYDDRDNLPLLYQKIDALAIDHYEVRRVQKITRFWKVNCVAAVPEITNPRPSQELLKSILYELFGVSPTSSLLMKSIAGKVGATNGYATSKDAGEIYGLLKLRFEKTDIKKDESMSKVIAHRLFADFLTNKAHEISRRDPNKPNKNHSVIMMHLTDFLLAPNQDCYELNAWAWAMTSAMIETVINNFETMTYDPSDEEPILFGYKKAPFAEAWS